VVLGPLRWPCRGLGGQHGRVGYQPAGLICGTVTSAWVAVPL